MYYGLKKSILVVDDDITTLTAIRKILEHNYNISLAKSASQAWEILNNTPVDLILLDVEMPMMSGLDFINYLQSNEVFTHIPIIFVTSHGTQDVLKKAMVSGAKSFIVKPVSEESLIEKIKSVLVKSVPQTDRERLLQKLHLINIACKTENAVELEKVAKDLQKMRYNVGTDTMVNAICKEVSFHNYNAISEKVKELIKNNLFDVRRGND